LGRSLRFYEQTVGLAIYREWGSGSSRGVVFFLGGCGLLELSGGRGRPPSDAVSLVLQVRDFHATREHLVHSGVTVEEEPELKSWGLLEMTVHDPDGLALIFERDGFIAAIEAGAPESVWVSEQLGVPVFKVFNGIFWKHLLEGGLPHGSAGRIALPVAGDDAAGKQIVFDLVNELGFDPVDGGTLGESWRQQPGTPVYGTDLDPREQSERSQRPRPNA
jgi:hypothetical protein